MNDDVFEPINLLTKSLGKYLKNIGKKKCTFNVRKSNNPTKNRTNPIPSEIKKGDKIQCRECRRYSHIQVECTNTLKNIKNNFNITWNDNKLEEEQDEHEDVISNNRALATTAVEKKNRFIRMVFLRVWQYQAGITQQFCSMKHALTLLFCRNRSKVRYRF